MRIQHNIAAMNSYRNFSANNSSLNKNLEKLSTGYKINRAGDDAAGLAISEKMRAQISGLEGATKNAKDGISLVQTAEGALTEVHDMLNRMTTLAEQSANGTYQDELDREQLQKEISQLQSEIDRIADSTNFNGLKLLDGSLDSTTVTTDTTQWTNAPDNILAANATSEVVGSGTILHKGNTTEAVSAEFTVNLNNLTPAFSLSSAVGNTTDTVTIRVGKGASAATPGNVADANNPEAGQVNQDLTVTADEIQKAYENGDTTAQAIAKAVVYKYGGADYNEIATSKGITQVATSQAGLTVYGENSDGSAVVGEHFDISLGDNGALKFTQSTAPATADNVVDTRLEVSVETTNYSLPSEITADAGYKNGFKLSDFTVEAEDGADEEAVAALQEALKEGKTLTLTTSASAKDNNTTLAIGGTLGAVTYGNGSTSLKVQFVDHSGELADENAVTFKSTPENDGELAATATSVSFAITDDAGKKLATFSVDLDAWAATGADSFNIAYNNDTSSALSDYNAATTVISEPTVASTAHLASTYISTENLWDKIKDGSMIEIGGEAYTFAVGSASTVDKTGKNVVDLTDMVPTNTGYLETSGNTDYSDVKTALQRLTKVASDNEMYSVGFDESGGVNGVANGILTLTENVTYKGDADLTTRSGIAETIRFSDGATSSTSEASGKALTLQIGDTADSYNKLSVNITDMHAASLGIGADDLDISTQEGAAAALDKIKSAVNQVSDVRGNLGALQNRLDHTINNLGVMRENIQSAESNIRDTDVAEEMMNYTKNNILNQSAQAMLAQANQLPQGVLQLLG